MPADPPDLESIETIIGKPLPQDWPPHALPAGTRVTVVHSDTWAGPWRDEFSATIDDMAAPELVDHRMASEGELAYWVNFDTSQYDAAGDGPYRKAQIWARYLRPSL